MTDSFSSNVLEDLWPEILKRLPDVKTICQLRCICRSWNSLLSSPYFASLHLQFTTSIAAGKTPGFQILFFIATILLGRRRDGIHAALDFPVTLRFQRCPSSFCCSMPKIFGIVHGVVGFYYSSDDSSSDVVYIWNSCIRRYIVVPLPFDSKHEGHYGYFNFIGFGYDSSTNDFKLVLIPYKEKKYFFIYSIRNNVWKRKIISLDDVQYYNSIGSLDQPPLSRRLPCYETTCFFKGVIHSRVKDFGGRYKILLFDCKSEDFKTMDLPRQLGEDVDLTPILLVYEGLLSSLRSVHDKYEVWTMKEYGVVSSWSKDCVIDDPTNIYPLVDESMFFMDIGMPCKDVYMDCDDT